MNRRHVLQFLAACACGPLALVATAAQQQPTAVFSAAQASAGQQVYTASCASCHQANLAGGNEAPPLAGVNFLNVWRDRPIAQLHQLIETTMPPGGPRLSPDQAIAVTA